ncbi:hypothetical protein TEA_012525 [Camellia sinensis var. sinensis]|uniref:Uncharacterized protein n=1 Tax=Camellia sinensis var. sinensis TaxID=542762 RepID=A0A4V3WMY7_CAMSN|nr:hypothetical protein TEA_012525 [Camellia sinensis var. sinensis]
MHELAEQICTLMVEYVKGLKEEMAIGMCLHLLGIVEEMGGALRDGKLEFEQARKKTRVLENRKIEALRRLKESEERITRMKEYLGFLLEAKKESMEHIFLHKYGGRSAKDERLLWELLKNKRKDLTPESPFGPQELLSILSNNYHLKPTQERTQISHRPITRNYLQKLTPQTPCLDSCLPFNSSPSVTTQWVFQRNRITL